MGYSRGGGGDILFERGFVVVTTFMIDSSSLSLPEPESVECQIGILGANLLWA